MNAIETETNVSAGRMESGNGNKRQTNAAAAMVCKPTGWTPEKRARLGRKSPHPEIGIVAKREGLSRSHVWNVFHGRRASVFVTRKLVEARAELAAGGTGGAR